VSPKLLCNNVDRLPTFATSVGVIDLTVVTGGDGSTEEMVERPPTIGGGGDRHGPILPF
jgi:hypothetical protein